MCDRKEGRKKLFCKKWMSNKGKNCESYEMVTGNNF